MSNTIPEDKQLEQKRRRSLGVTIFGWLFILNGILYFVGTFVLLFLIKIPNEKLFSIINDMSPLYDPLFAVGFIFIGRGLLQLRMWARKVTIWISALAIVAAILVIFLTSTPSIEVLFVLIINSISFHFFVFVPKVKEQFVGVSPRQA